MMDNRIDFVVSGILKQDNQVLMVWHKKLNAWLFPGGHVENGETLDEALVREFREETGVEVHIQDKKNGNIATKDVCEENMPFCILKEPIDTPGDFHYHLDFIFFVDRAGPREIVMNDDMKWVGSREAGELQTPANVKNILSSVLSTGEG